MAILLAGCGGSGLVEATSADPSTTEPADVDTAEPTDTALDTDTGTDSSCPFDGSYAVRNPVLNVDGGTAVIAGDGFGCVLDLVLPTAVDGCEMTETCTFELAPGGLLWEGTSNGVLSTCDGVLWDPYAIPMATFEWSSPDVLSVARQRALLSGTLLELTL